MTVKKDDGFFPELFKLYNIKDFDGYDEYPMLSKNKEIVIPKNLFLTAR